MTQSGHDIVAPLREFFYGGSMFVCALTAPALEYTVTRPAKDTHSPNVLGGGENANGVVTRCFLRIRHRPESRWHFLLLYNGVVPNFLPRTPSHTPPLDSHTPTTPRQPSNRCRGDYPLKHGVNMINPASHRSDVFPRWSMQRTQARIMATVCLHPTDDEDRI